MRIWFGERVVSVEQDGVAIVCGERVGCGEMGVSKGWRVTTRRVVMKAGQLCACNMREGRGGVGWSCQSRGGEGRGGGRREERRMGWEGRGIN